MRGRWPYIVVTIFCGVVTAAAEDVWFYGSAVRVAPTTS